MSYSGDIAFRLRQIADEIAGPEVGMDVIVSCNEAARLLGKSPATVSHMIREGRLEKVTIKGSTGVRLNQVMALKR